MNKKRGFSLIVLVITIIVLTILSSTVILSISGKDNQIAKAEEAAILTNISVLKEELATRLSLEPRTSFEDVDVVLNKNDAILLEERLNEKEEKLAYYMPSIEKIKLTDKIAYSDILTIQDGALVIYTDNQLEEIFFGQITIEEEARKVIEGQIGTYVE